VRGSDPDAALYWFARMLEGGEDPRFLARRITRMAVEDIGWPTRGAAALP
jgi:putative ATPase